MQFIPKHGYQIWWVYVNVKWSWGPFGAPADSAHIIQNWLRLKGCSFINKDEWPPNLPNLSTLDCHVWGAMLEVYHKLQPNPETVLELKDALQRIWTALLQKSNCRRGVKDSRKQLKACVPATVWHFKCDYWHSSYWQTLVLYDFMYCNDCRWKKYSSGRMSC